MAERVLVVEDEPDVLDALVQLLAHAGYEARPPVLDGLVRIGVDDVTANVVLTKMCSFAHGPTP